MIKALEMVQTIPRRTILRRYDEFKTKWNTCTEAHNTYLASLTELSNKEAEKNWINKVTMECLKVFEMASDIFIEQISQEQELCFDKSWNVSANSLAQTLEAMQSVDGTSDADIRGVVKFKAMQPGVTDVTNIRRVDTF